MSGPGQQALGRGVRGNRFGPACSDSVTAWSVQPVISRRICSWSGWSLVRKGLYRRGDATGQQVVGAVAQPRVEADLLGLLVQPHVVYLALFGDQETGQFQIRGESCRDRLLVAGDLLPEQESHQ